MKRIHLEIVIGLGTSSDKNEDNSKRDATLNRVVPVVAMIGFIISIVVMKSMGM